MRILDYLSDKGVDFTVKHHDELFTAQREAEALHVKGQVFVKTVVIKAGDDYLLLALPASCRVSMARLREALGVEVRMSTEDEMAELFPDCDLGAEPPFGSLYGLRTLVDEQLVKQETIVIRAGTHKDVVLLAYADFAKLEAPQVASFCTAGTY